MFSIFFVQIFSLNLFKTWFLYNFDNAILYMILKRTMINTLLFNFHTCLRKNQYILALLEYREQYHMI